MVANFSPSEVSHRMLQSRINGDGRYFEHFGRLFHAESAKEAHFDDLGLRASSRASAFKASSSAARSGAWPPPIKDERQHRIHLGTQCNSRRVEEGRGPGTLLHTDPFPFPAHQTGHAHFEHPAFRLVSPQRPRKRSD